MERDRSYVQLRLPRGGDLTAKIVAEENGTLALVPSGGGRSAPRGPEPVEVGWMTWSGMVWCGGLLVSRDDLEGTIDVRLLGPPVPVERRRHVRLPVDLEAEIFPAAGTAESIRGTCVDLSPSGMQVVLPTEITVGEVVRIVLRGESGEALQATARVARRVGPARFGFAFELVILGSPDEFARFALDQATRFVGVGR